MHLLLPIVNLLRGSDPFVELTFLLHEQTLHFNAEALQNPLSLLLSLSLMKLSFIFQTEEHGIVKCISQFVLILLFVPDLALKLID